MQYILHIPRALWALSLQLTPDAIGARLCSSQIPWDAPAASTALQGPIPNTPAPPWDPCQAVTHRPRSASQENQDFAQGL